MSSSSGSGRATIAEVIPKEWQAFLTSGEYAGTRASIQVDGSEVPVEFVARLEFLDERRLAIHVALAEGGRPAAVSQAPALVRRLTARERAVIALIAQGRETQDIAEALHVSPSTVRTHVRNSMSKLGAHTRAQLVALVVAGEEALQMTRADENGSDISPEGPGPGGSTSAGPRRSPRAWLVESGYEVRDAGARASSMPGMSPLASRVSI
jgi:DNA-binding CsgD family transcriptional regulator